MKEIQTKKFKEVSADSIRFPAVEKRSPIFRGQSDSEQSIRERVKRKKMKPTKKKKLYQLDRSVDDVDMSDIDEG
jgi:hypothetical protein